VNRYVVVRDLHGADAGSTIGDTADWLVVDLQNTFVIARCGDSVGRAEKVAQALNDLDGGPL
jgi:hypothetical protein